MGIKVSGSTGGSPYISFDIAGMNGYSIGADNADGDKFKLYSNYDFTGTALLTADRSTLRVGILNTSP